MASALKLISGDYRSYRKPLLAQGFWATMLHRLLYPTRYWRPSLLAKSFRGLHLIAIKWSELLFGISIGIDVKLGERFTIEHFGGVIIHAKAVIGSDVRLRQNVTIGNASALRPDGVPVIEDHVEVCAGAVII